MSQQTQTHINTVVAQYAYNTKQVLWLTGMSEEEFYTLMYETGLAWLKSYTGADTEQLNMLLQDAAIGGWWKNEWYIRDDELYLEALYRLEGRVRLARYRALHQNVFIPHSTIQLQLINKYACAVGEFNDRKTGGA